MALYERDGNGNLKTIAKERYWIPDGDTVYLWDEGQPRDTKTAKRIRFSDLSANEYLDPKANQSYEQAMADPKNKDKTKQILDVVTKMKDVYGLDVKTSWEPYKKTGVESKALLEHVAEEYGIILDNVKSSNRQDRPNEYLAKPLIPVGRDKDGNSRAIEYKQIAGAAGLIYDYNTLGSGKGNEAYVKRMKGLIEGIDTDSIYDKINAYSYGEGTEQEKGDKLSFNIFNMALSGTYAKDGMQKEQSLPATQFAAEQVADLKSQPWYNNTVDQLASRLRVFTKGTNGLQIEALGYAYHKNAREYGLKKEDLKDPYKTLASVFVQRTLGYAAHMYGVEYDTSKDKDNAEIVFANTANAILNPTLKETDRDKFWQIIDRAAMFRGGDKGLLTTFGVVTSFDKVMGNNITNKSADDGTFTRGAKTAWNTFWSSNIIGNAWKMVGNDYVGQETESTVLPKLYADVGNPNDEFETIGSVLGMTSAIIAQSAIVKGAVAKGKNVKMAKRVGDVYKYVGLAGANDLMANLANANAYRLSEQYIGEEGNPLKAINSMANNMAGMYAMDKIGESVLNRVVLKKSFFDVLKGSVAKGAVGQKATESMATALANARIWNKTLIGNASYAVADLAGGLLVDKAIYETMDKMYEIAGVRGEVFDYGTRGQLDTFNKETLKMVLAQRLGSKLAGQFIGATQDKLAESFGRTATPSVGSRRWASDLKTYTTKEGLGKEELSAFEKLTLTMNDFLLPNMYKGLDHIYSKEKKSFMDEMRKTYVGDDTKIAFDKNNMDLALDNMMVNYLAAQGTLNVWSMFGQNIALGGTLFKGGLEGIKGKDSNGNVLSVSYKDLANKLLYSKEIAMDNLMTMSSEVSRFAALNKVAVFDDETISKLDATKKDYIANVNALADKLLKYETDGNDPGKNARLLYATTLLNLDRNENTKKQVSTFATQIRKALGSKKEQIDINATDVEKARINKKNSQIDNVIRALDLTDTGTDELLTKGKANSSFVRNEFEQLGWKMRPYGNPAYIMSLAKNLDDFLKPEEKDALWKIGFNITGNNYDLDRHLLDTMTGIRSEIRASLGDKTLTSEQKLDKIIEVFNDPSKSFSEAIDRLVDKYASTIKRFKNMDEKKLSESDKASVTNAIIRMSSLVGLAKNQDRAIKAMADVLTGNTSVSKLFTPHLRAEQSEYIAELKKKHSDITDEQIDEIVMTNHFNDLSMMSEYNKTFNVNMATNKANYELLIKQWVLGEKKASEIDFARRIHTMYDMNHRVKYKFNIDGIETIFSLPNLNFMVGNEKGGEILNAIIGSVFSRKFEEQFVGTNAGTVGEHSITVKGIEIDVGIQKNLDDDGTLVYNLKLDKKSYDKLTEIGIDEWKELFQSTLTRVPVDHEIMNEIRGVKAGNGLTSFESEMINVIGWTKNGVTKIQSVDNLVDDVAKFYNNGIDMQGLAFRMLSYEKKNADNVIAFLRSYIKDSMVLLKRFPEATIAERDILVDELAKTVAIRAMSMQDFSFTINFDRNGVETGIVVVPEFKHTIGSLSGKNISGKHAVTYAGYNLAFAPDTPQETKDAVLNRLLNKGMFTLGQMGNNLEYKLFRLSVDITKEENFRSYIKDVEFKDSFLSVWYDEIGLAGPTKAERDRMGKAWNGVRDKSEGFTDFMRKFMGKLIDLNIAEIEQIASTGATKKTYEVFGAKFTFQEALDKGLNVLSKDAQEVVGFFNDMNTKITAFRDDLVKRTDLTEKQREVYDRITGNLSEKLTTISKNLSRIGDGSPGIINGYIIKEISDKLLRPIAVLDETIADEVFSTLLATSEGIKTVLSDAASIISQALTVVTGVPLLDHMVKTFDSRMKDISSSVLFDTSKLFLNDADDLKKLSEGFESYENAQKAKLAKKAIELLNDRKKEITDDTGKYKSENDVKKLMGLFFNMSDKILYADYPSKRGSYGLYSPITDDVINKINDIYNDAYAVTVFIDAAMMDGVNVMSSEMLYYLAYGKPNGLGKVAGYLSKNLAMSDTELTSDQCKILFQSIKKNAPAEVGLRNKLRLPDGTDEEIAKAMVVAIKDKKLTINTMSSESSKALSVDIIKGMSDNHNVLYSGTFSNMKNRNNPMYNQLVRTAVHNFTMSNSGDKGLAEQLLMNAMGLAYTNAFVDENLTSFRIDDMKISDDITASIADTVKKQFAKLSRFIELPGMTGVAKTIDIGDTDLDFYKDNDARMAFKVPTLNIGAHNLAMTALEIVKKNKDNNKGTVSNQEIVRIADKLFKEKDISGMKDDMITLFEFLVKNDAMAKVKNVNGEYDYLFLAVRYPIVAGTNMTYVKINGIKAGSYGIDVFKPTYKKVLKGDWDGDTVQILALPNYALKKMLPTGTREDDYHTAIISQLQNLFRIEMSSISEGGRPSYIDGGDNAITGEPLFELQTEQQIHSSNVAVFNEAIGVVRNTYNDKGGLKETAENIEYSETITLTSIVSDPTDVSTRAKQKEYPIVQFDTNIDFHKTGDNYILLEVHSLDKNKPAKVIGSLGSNKFTKKYDSTTAFALNHNIKHTINKDTPDESTYRVFDLGNRLQMIAIERSDSPGIFKIVDVISAVYNNGQLAEKMNPRHDDGRFNVDGVNYDVFKGKAVTQVMSIDRGLDASSTSRAKLQNLSLTTEGNINAEKFGTFIGELIMASGIHITVDPNKGVLIGGMKYSAAAKSSAQAQISMAKSQVDNYIDNKFLTKAEYKSLIKFLKPAQPKGEDKANGLKVLAKVLENFHTFAPYLPPSIKSVIIAFVKQDVDLSMGGYNIVKAWGENLKELLPGKDEGVNPVISYTELTDEYIKQLEVSRSIKNFMNNMAVSPLSVEGSDRLLTTLGLSQGKITTTFITDRDTPREFMNDIAVHATKLAGNALIKPLKTNDIETFISSLDYKIGNKLNSTSNEESIILKHGNDIENNKNDFSTLQFLDGNSKPIRTEEVLDKIAAQIIGKENDSLNDKLVKRSIANALISSMDLANQRVVSNYSNGMTSKVLTTIGNSREGKRFKVTPEFASNFKTLTHIFDPNELNALIKRDVSSCK